MTRGANDEMQVAAENLLAVVEMANACGVKVVGSAVSIDPDTSIVQVQCASAAERDRLADSFGFPRRWDVPFGSHNRPLQARSRHFDGQTISVWSPCDGLIRAVAQV